MIERLSYFSSLARGYDLEDLEQIARESKPRNQAENITGIMLFAHGSIFHLLEGPPDPINALFAKIESDPRHTGLIPLTRNTCRFRLTDSTRFGFLGQGAEDTEDPLFLFRSQEQVKRHISDAPDAQEHVFLNTFLRNSSCAA